MSEAKAQPVAIKFERGLRQELEANDMPPGALVVANDVEFDKLRRLQKRDGFTELGVTTLSKTNSYTGPARRLAVGALGEQLVFTDENTHVYFPEYNKLSEAGQAGAAGGQISAMRAQLTERFTVGSDQAGQFSVCDCALSGSWIVVAYVQLRSDGSALDLKVDVLDKETKAKALSGFMLDLAIGAVPASAGNLQIRALVPLTAPTKVVIIWAVGASIKASVLDLSGTTISNPTVSTLVSNAEVTLPLLDASPSVGGFVLAYRYRASLGNNWVRAITYTPALAVINGPVDLQGLGATTYNASAVAVVGARTVADTIFVVAANIALTQLEQYGMTSALGSITYDSDTYTAADPAADLAHDARQITLGRMTTTKVAILWSSCVTKLTQGGVSNGPRGAIFIGTITQTGGFPVYLGVQPAFSNYVLGSRFFSDSVGNLYAWGRFNVSEGQSHYLLLDFCGGANQTFRRPMPVLHVASGLVPSIGISSGGATGPVGVPAFADLGNDQWLFCAPVNIGASSISGMQIACFKGECLGHGRFLSVIGHKSLFIAGGTPLAYDGQRLAELGFYSYPEASDPVASGVGSGLSAGTYRYRFVYEWTDAAGNRHQSPATPEVSVTVTAGQNVALEVSTIHATRKQVTPNNLASLAYDDAAPIRVVVYRTQADAPTFRRLTTPMTNKLSTALAGNTAAHIVTMSDTESDASIGGNEMLYTTSGGQGKLSSNAPPPCAMMTIHNGRLWGLDAENPERLWCTKTFEDGEAPGYNPGLQVLIAGAVRLNGIAGQDDKLYGLAEGGTYTATYGPGPDNTGQGFFPDPVLITTSATCDESRGVITSSAGIYFSGQDHWGSGIYMIRRGDGSPVSIGDRVRNDLNDSTFGNPVIRGVCERIDKGRIEFLCVDTEPTATRGSVLYYHFDLVDEANLGQWTKAKPCGGAGLECIAVWDGFTVIGTNNANPQFQIVKQTGRYTINTTSVPGVDIGSVFQFDVVTGDVRPFGPTGYGDVHSLSLFGTGRTRAGFLSVESSYDSRLTFPDTIGTNTPELNGTPIARRWETATKKLPLGSASYRFREILTVGGSIYTDGPILHGFTLEAVPIGGQFRLPLTSRDNETAIVPVVP